jgi:hypothetical protein
MQVRTLQLDDANKSLEALRTSRNAPLSRYKYYTSLAGATQAQLAETDVDYTEIPLAITAPLTDGDLVVTSGEKDEVEEAKTAADKNKTIGYVEVTAGTLFALPIVSEKVTPWGLGVGFAWGASNFAQAAQAYARFMRIDADDHSFNSTNASRKTALVKQYQERIQAANAAGWELLNVNTNMVIQQTKINIAAQEINNQQKAMDNANEVMEFLQDKYTNDDLYAFLEDSVRTNFYQLYTLAYDFAKKAEATFTFERGPQTSPFIQFGYWDARRDGLQSGEALYLALKKLEAAYLETRGYDFEVTKSISIRQLSPLALLQLRETGTCQVEFPEVIFDMDFPGHYFRRIKSVAITMPCVVGPYTNIPTINIDLILQRQMRIATCNKTTTAQTRDSSL